MWRAVGEQGGHLFEDRGQEEWYEELREGRPGEGQRVDCKKQNKSNKKSINKKSVWYGFRKKSQLLKILQKLIIIKPKLGSDYKSFYKEQML